MSVIFAIFLFSVLIFVHELGHFTAAKLSGVQVNEFSMFMGPAIWKKQVGETLYAIRCIPIGGYCAMEGEDGGSDNPRSFDKAAWWKRLIILAAGAAMNFLIGVVLMVIVCLPVKQTVVPVIASFEDYATVNGENGLQAGDRIVEVDGEKLYSYSDFSMILSLNPGDVHDITVRRNGEKVVLKDFLLEKHEVTLENGSTGLRYGMNFTLSTPNFWEKLGMAWNQSLDTVRMVRLSLQMLLGGKVGIKDMSGPVGIVSEMSKVAAASDSKVTALLNMLYFGGFIAINLAVMNLLPIPALDGGRIVCLLITVVVEAITKKKINPKYEGYLHGAGMILLLALMAILCSRTSFSCSRGEDDDKTNSGGRRSHRRRRPGGHPVHAQYQNHGCGGQPEADPSACLRRVPDRPTGSSQHGSRPELC